METQTVPQFEIKSQTQKYLIVGPICSGKTSIAKRIAGKIPSQFIFTETPLDWEGYHHVYSMDLFPDVLKKWTKTFKLCYERQQSLPEHKFVIDRTALPTAVFVFDRIKRKDIKTAQFRKLMSMGRFYNATVVWVIRSDEEEDMKDHHYVTDLPPHFRAQFDHVILTEGISQRNLTGLWQSYASTIVVFADFSRVYHDGGITVIRRDLHDEFPLEKLKRI